MFRRFCAVLALMAIALSAAAAHAQETIKLEVVVFADSMAEWYNTEGKKFSEANPGITVEARVVPGGVNGLTDHITTRLAAGDPPDMADNVLRVYHSWADHGYLVDMLPLFERSRAISEKDLIPGFLRAKMYHGGLYNAPTTIDPFVTAYDVSAFEEAGLSDPYTMYRSGEWSWRTGREAAQKLTRKNGDGEVTQWGWNPAVGTDWSWGSYVVANGGRILSEDLRSVELTKEPAREAIDFITQLYNVYEVGTRRGFQAKGDVAMATANSIQLFRHFQAYGRPVAAAPIAPPSPGQTPAGMMFADGPIIFDKGKNVEAAWKFVEWLLQDGAQRSNVDIQGRVPGRLDTLLNDWAETAGAYIGGPERAHLWSDAAANGRLLPFGPFYAEMFSVMNPAVNSILDGKAPLGPTLDETARQMQAIVDKYAQN